jgi:hypothetical protein
MKKLLYLLTLIAFMGISANTFAQGTGVAPHIGSKHTYSVTEHTGNTYAWSVTTDAAGNTAATVATLSSTTGHEIEITWVSPTPGTTYFVHVVETASAANGGCTNHKVLAVTPSNEFDMAVVAINEDDSAVLTGADLEACAPDVKVTGFTAPQNFTYDYGDNYFYYKITATGIGSNSWNAVFDIKGSDGDAVYTATYGKSIATIEDNNLVADGTLNTINTIASTEVIYVKVKVDNAEGATAANNVSLTLSTTSTDVNGNAVKDPITTPVSTQIVKARPATSGIGTDL